MKWRVKIEKVDNGYIVDYAGGDWNTVKTYTDCTRDGDEILNKEHVVEMLWDILEYFAEGGSKHDKKRISIEWR